MYIHSTPHQAPSCRPPHRSASHQGWTPQDRREDGGRGREEKSARGWHGLRRFDSEVGLCMVSVRETLGKRFLLLARTGQGLLALAKPNRFSDQDKIQNFSPSCWRQRRKIRDGHLVHTHLSSGKQLDCPVGRYLGRYLDRSKAPCWPGWAFLP